MTSTWYGAASASNGTSYLCALEYHDGDMNLNALATHTFSQFVNVAYFPQYYCWNGTNSAIGFSHAEIFGSGSVTATNWDVTTNHHWGAGYLYTLGSGSVTGSGTPQPATGSNPAGTASGTVVAPSCFSGSEFVGCGFAWFGSKCRYRNSCFKNCGRRIISPSY